MENREARALSFMGLIKNFSQTLFKYVGDLVLLAKLEAQLARKSLVYIAILSFIGFIFLLSTWFGIFIFIVISLIALGLPLLGALAATIGINLLLLAIIGLWIFKLKSNLYFSATRKQLSFKGKKHE